MSTISEQRRVYIDDLLGITEDMKISHDLNELMQNYINIDSERKDIVHTETKAIKTLNRADLEIVIKLNKELVHVAKQLYNRCAKNGLSTAAKVILVYTKNVLKFDLQNYFGDQTKKVDATNGAVKNKIHVNKSTRQRPLPKRIPTRYKENQAKKQMLQKLEKLIKEIEEKLQPNGRKVRFLSQ